MDKTLLRYLAQEYGSIESEFDLDTARDLERSGFVTIEDRGEEGLSDLWYITDAGRAALAAPEPESNCTYCHGEGSIEREFYGGQGGFKTMLCPACGGTGNHADEIERRARMARNEPVFADSAPEPPACPNCDAERVMADGDGWRCPFCGWRSEPSPAPSLVCGKCGRAVEVALHTDAGWFTVTHVCPACGVVAQYGEKEPEAQSGDPTLWQRRYLAVTEEARASKAQADELTRKLDALEVRYAALVDAAREAGAGA